MRHRRNTSRVVAIYLLGAGTIAFGAGLLVGYVVKALR